MGEAKVELNLENYNDRVLVQSNHLPETEVRSRKVSVLVDTGAVMSMLPQDLVESLGLSLLGKVIVTCTDDRREERDVAGVVTVRVNGRSMQTTCVVGPPGSEPLLGQIVLEETDLLVDPTNHCLVRRPESPYLPTRKMKRHRGRVYDFQFSVAS